MKCYVSVVCVLSAFLAVALAAPATIEDTELAPVHNQVKRQTADNSEALNRVVGYLNQKLQQLRRICPQPFQILDLVIQNVTSQVFRVVGGALLRTNLGGGASAGGSSSSSGGGSGGGRVSVVLPTFPPDEDDEDEDDTDEEDEDVDLRLGGETQTTSTSTSSSPVALSAEVMTSTDNNEIDGDSSDSRKSTGSSSSSTSTAASTASTTSSTTIENSVTASVFATPDAPFTSPALANTAKRHIRIPREAENQQEDQDAAASGGNGPDPNSDLSDVDTDDDADRNKRLVPPFGGDGQSGGSGNFLFDLIRLVAGSGATEESDEKSVGIGGVAEVDVQPKSTEGIPGPITRLLVIANRGIANLIQDLILRLAQTSERIVNFKARLVTALI